MKRLVVILGIFFLVACGVQEVEFRGIDGTDGIDGIDGIDGLNSLVTFTALNSEAEICDSGSGYMFSSGLDANRNNILDVVERNMNYLNFVII